MTKKKISSLVLSLVLIAGTILPTFGNTLDRTNKVISKVTYTASNETVRVIVELEQAPLLDRSSARGMRLNALDSTFVTEETEKLELIQEDVKDKINLISNDIVYRHSYVRAYNGFSADVKYSAIAEIEALDQVKSVHIANQYEKPEPQLITSGGMINVSSMWTLGYKGEGMLVAVLDTGIDYQHVAFTLTNDSDAKLNLSDISAILLNNTLSVEEYAASKSLAITASDVYKSPKVPFAFDYADIDTDVKPNLSRPQASMHGVHVSGIVAANGTTVKGIAPEAQIAAMKIFSDTNPYAYEDDIVAGIDDAILLGADVINMSIGSTAGFTDDEDPEQQAITRAKNAGIIVAVSAGNASRFGKGSGFSQDLTYTRNPDTGLLASPSAGKGTFSVASIEKTASMAPYALSFGGTKVQYEASGSANPVVIFNAGPKEYVYCGIGALSDFDGINVIGKIALISRGSIAFTEKITNAQANGAVGIIIYNNQGNSMISMMYPETGTIPALFIGQTDGVALKDAATKRLTFNPSYLKSYINPTAGQISNFSSWGPTPSLEFKPEITAPGGNIYSTLNDNSYGSLSGTSMAAPHIAGASAIMLEYIRVRFPALNASEQGIIAKALMMSTAVPVLYDGVEYSPRQQGAGMLDLEAAVGTDVYAYATSTSGEAKIALGEINTQFSYDITLKNFGGTNHEFAVSISALTDSMFNGNSPYNIGKPIDLTGAVIKVSGLNVKTAQVTTAGIYAITPDVAANTINVFNASDIMTTSESPIVIVPVASNSTEIVTVTVDLTNINPNLRMQYENGFFAEGFVQFLSISEADDNPNLSIPYMGFVGEWEAAPIFDDDIYMGNENAYYDPQFQSMVSIVDTGGGMYDSFSLGVNDLDNTKSYDNIAFSPNSDGAFDNAAVLMSLIRNAKTINVSIAGANHQIIEYLSLNEVANIRKPYLYYSSFVPYEFPTPDNELSSLIWNGELGGQIAPEGQYYYVIEASIDGGFGTQIYTYPIYLDLTAPTISDRIVANNTLVISATDNHAIMSYQIVDASGTVIASSVTNTFDVTAIDLSDLKLIVTDYAGNRKEVSAQPEVVILPPPPTPAPAPAPAPTPPAPAPTPPIVTPPSTTDPAVLPVIETPTASTVSVLTATLKAQIASTSGKSVVLKLPNTLNTVKPLEITIQTSSLKELLAAGKELVFEGKNVTFKLGGDFTDLTSASNVVVKFVKSSVEQYGVSNEFKPLNIVYDFDILVDGIKLKTFNRRPEITLTLPTGTKFADKIGAYVQNANGSWTYVMSFYDQASNSIRFKAPHFSKYALMQYSKTFNDIKGHWAQANIEEMASKHVVSGTDVDANIFTPGKSVTNAEFVTMIIRALGETAGGTGTFNDVSSSSWYAGYLAKAKDLDLIQADSSGNIKPLEFITRQEIATITAKAHALINTIKLIDKTPSVTFKDASSISEQNSTYVGYVQSRQIIVGYNNLFRPLDLATRAEAVSIIKAMLEK